MHHSYLESIKSFEGFTGQAQWDYAQFTNGYGTKALYPGEAITPDEAERRFAAEIAAARSIVEKHAAGWDEGTKAALTSLTFNAGTRWINSGLGEAVRNKDIDGVRERFVQYTKAGGEVLPGLVRRRLTELTWIGSGTPPTSNTPPSPSHSVPSPTRGLSAPATATATAGAPGPAADAGPAGSVEQVLAALGPGDEPEGSHPSLQTPPGQKLSLLVSLLFDLQMRSALPDPMTPGETAADRQARTT